MRFIFTVIIVMFELLFSARASYAGTWNIQLAPAWWQYSENAVTRPGFSATPLHSKSTGIGLEATLAKSFDFNSLWSVTPSVQSLLSIASTSERWQLNPASMQTNQLNIAQGEFKFLIQRKIIGLQTGLWGSYQYHKQQRQRFVVNNIPQSIGKNNEIVRTGWVGASLSSRSGQGFNLELEGGIPVWVKTTNDLVTGSFSRRIGFRAGVHASMLLPWSFRNETNHAIFNYQYRQLGGEQISTKWLWPKNRWQSISLGIATVW